MKGLDPFYAGFRAMLPAVVGVIPFGAVMGTVFADARLDLFKSGSMNALVYAGAAQLASMELMTKNAPSLVVIASGLIINLRFLLYSAALSPFLRNSGFWTKLFSSYSLTDQGFAVMSSVEEKFKDKAEAIRFYMGTAVCMLVAWHSSVLAGFVFGNFAPASLALDYAVPLSFVALVIPTLRNRKYVAVAAFSSVMSLLLYSLPFKTGLLATALLSIGLGVLLSRKRLST